MDDDEVFEDDVNEADPDVAEDPDFDGDIDGDGDDIGVDDELDDDAGSEDGDDEDEEDDTPAASRARRTAEDDDDDEDLDPDDVEADLDTILKDRIASGDGDDEEDEDEAPVSDSELVEGVVQKREGEFTCMGCFMIVHPRQFGRRSRLTCPTGDEDCPSIEIVAALLDG